MTLLVGLVFLAIFWLVILTVGQWKQTLRNEKLERRNQWYMQQIKHLNDGKNQETQEGESGKTGETS